MKIGTPVDIVPARNPSVKKRQSKYARLYGRMRRTPGKFVPATMKNRHEVEQLRSAISVAFGKGTYKTRRRGKTLYCAAVKPTKVDTLAA